MPSEDDRWFVAERGEALAGLLLTSRGDVRIQSKKATGDGVDFLVAVDEGESLSTGLFVVRVKGTTSSEESEWMRGVNEVFQPHSQSISLPECVFVVNIRILMLLFGCPTKNVCSCHNFSISSGVNVRTCLMHYTKTCCSCSVCVDGRYDRIILIINH